MGVNKFELPMGLQFTTATYYKGQPVTKTSALSSRWAIPPIRLSFKLDLRDFVAVVSIIHICRSQFIYLWDHCLQNALYSIFICFQMLRKCQFPLSLSRNVRKVLLILRYINYKRLAFLLCVILVVYLWIFN